MPLRCAWCGSDAVLVEAPARGRAAMSCVACGSVAAYEPAAEARPRMRGRRPGGP